MFFNRLGNKKAIKELEKVQKKLKEVTDTLHHLQAGLCAASVDDTTQIHVAWFRKKQMFFNLRGETQYKICTKCGKVLNAVFVSND